jgi:hypothetical protein
MKIPFSDLIIPKRMIYDLLWGMYPICLYYGMVTYIKFVPFIQAFSSRTEGEFFAMFLLVIPSFLVAGLLYKPIDTLKKGRRRLAKAIYQCSSYPIEFLAYSIPLLIFQEEKMYPFARTNFYLLFLIFVSSYIERAINLSSSRQKKIGQEVLQEGFTRIMIIFILCMISVFIFIRR